jgi:hypothetical protein
LRIVSSSPLKIDTAQFLDTSLQSPFSQRKTYGHGRTVVPVGNVEYSEVTLLAVRNNHSSCQRAGVRQEPKLSVHE